MVEDTVRIDILDHADFCGEIRGDKYIPGLRKFHQSIESVRRNNPDGTVLLDAGDEINRLLWHGKDVLDTMALIGTDAWTLGNHEFDRGQKELEDNIAYIHDRIPVLCANIVEKKTGQLIPNVKPYHVMERKGVRIGVIGVTTEYTERMVTWPNFESYQVTSAAEAIRKYNAELKKQGTDIVIVLAHIGSYSRNGIHEGELIDLLEDIKDINIDLLIGGHLNGDIYQEFSGIMVNKGGFSGKSLIHTVLYFDKSAGKITNKEAEALYPIEDQYDIPDETIDSFVEKTISPYREYFEDVLTYASEDVLMNYNQESALGNLFADAVRDAVKTDFAYFNTTSCGPRIPEGPVTRYSVKQAIYFDEPVHVSEYTGREIRRLLEDVHNPDIYSKNFDLYFSGLRVVLNHSLPYGQKVVSMKWPDGREVEDDEVLTVATSEYMASGGNDTRTIAGKHAWTRCDVMIHEAIYDYLRKQSDLSNDIDGRYEFLSDAPQYDDH